MSNDFHGDFRVPLKLRYTGSHGRVSRAAPIFSLDKIGVVFLANGGK